MKMPHFVVVSLPMLCTLHTFLQYLVLFCIVLQILLLLSRFVSLWLLVHATISGVIFGKCSVLEIQLPLLKIVVFCQCRMQTSLVVVWVHSYLVCPTFWPAELVVLLSQASFSEA